MCSETSIIVRSDYIAVSSSVVWISTKRWLAVGFSKSIREVILTKNVLNTTWDVSVEFLRKNRCVIFQYWCLLCVHLIRITCKCTRENVPNVNRASSDLETLPLKASDLSCSYWNPALVSLCDSLYKMAAWPDFSCARNLLPKTATAWEIQMWMYRSIQVVSKLWLTPVRHIQR